LFWKFNKVIWTKLVQIMVLSSKENNQDNN